MAKMKMKLDTKKLKQVLTSRFEILGLSIAGVLVAVCLIWGCITFLGASSPEPQIRNDVAQMQNKHMGAPVPTPPDSTGKPVKPTALLAWPPVKDKADANLTYFPYIIPGAAGGTGRFNPRVLAVDNDPEGKSFQIDYLRRGALVYDVNESKQYLTTIDNAGAANAVPVADAAGLRLIVVSGTFPYHDQVVQFGKALGMPVEEVFAKGLAPTFEGLNIERRKIAMVDGKPVPGNWEALHIYDPQSDTVRFSKSLYKLLKTAVYDHKQVDKYHDVIFGASVMPLPRLIGSDYPDVQIIASRPAVPAGKADAKAPKDFGGAKVAADRLPFGPKPPQDVAGPADKDRTTAITKFDSLQVNLRDQVTGRINWFSPYGTFVDDQSKGNDNPKTEVKKDVKAANADAASNPRAPSTLPASPKALIRFMDAEVEPGAFYQYRVQVRLANPNYNQPAKVVAHVGLTKDKELPASKWEETSIIGPIPFEHQFYITTQEKGFLSKIKPEAKKAVQPIDTTTVNIADRQVPFQVHAFVDSVTDKDRKPHSVADWVVAERLLVGRGEAIGRKCEVEVAAWDKARGKMQLLGGAAAGSKASGAEVDFRAAPPVVLLDFAGGKQSYKNPKTGFPMPEEDSAFETLLLMSDGTMILKNSRDEQLPNSAVAQQRQQRYDEWQAVMKDVMQPPAKGDKK